METVWPRLVLDKPLAHTKRTYACNGAVHEPGIIPEGIF